jgi:hypothetical protein
MHRWRRQRRRRMFPGNRPKGELSDGACGSRNAAPFKTSGDEHHGGQNAQTHRQAPLRLSNRGEETRSLQLWLGHRSIQHTARCAELSAERFKHWWENPHFALAPQPVRNPALVSETPASYRLSPSGERRNRVDGFPHRLRKSDNCPRSSRGARGRILVMENALRTALADARRVTAGCDKPS